MSNWDKKHKEHFWGMVGYGAITIAAAFVYGFGAETALHIGDYELPSESKIAEIVGLLAAFAFAKNTFQSALDKLQREEASKPKRVVGRQ